MRIEGFVIHLARAEQRRPQVELLLNALPFPTQILGAVDGTVMSDHEITAVYRKFLHRPYYPFDLSRAEIGCFMSHRRAWRTIAESDLDGALVVEDDVVVEDPLFSSLLDFAVAHMKQGDYIRFPYRDRLDRGAPVASEGALKLIQPRLVGLGAQVQLVSRGAAIKLLEATELFDRPIDSFIQLRHLHHTRVLAARPAAISHGTDVLGGSTIHTQPKLLSEILIRELKRGWYRLIVRGLSLTRN